LTAQKPFIFPMVRTVWQLDDGDVPPRLITAYPIGLRR